MDDRVTYCNLVSVLLRLVYCLKDIGQSVLLPNSTCSSCQGGILSVWILDAQSFSVKKLCVLPSVKRNGRQGDVLPGCPH